ncbi:DUF2785 domain-containing protein [Weissella fangxianensis]|uniref:DUF2785 domain-containing protein n=1 Tax=Weissella fangxianensis TaxID=2953879 RepID=UPI0021585BF1|nr:DUF2785 domain-containing protein [Weissella fangxianensis]
MEYTTDDVREELKMIRSRVHAGTLFDSLGSEIGRLLDEFEYDAPTEVVQLSAKEATDIKERVLNWQQTLYAGQPVAISNQDVLDLMNSLRQTDPAVRDKGAFFFISDGLQNNVFKPNQLLLMVRYLLQDNVLFNHITETENDGVFYRSFSIFILSMLHYANRKGNVHFISEEVAETLFLNFATYIALEHDTRGFVGEKSWAHAFMHIGNLLDELVHDETLPRADKIFLLTILVERLKRLDTPLIMGENRRLIGFVADLVKTNELYSQYFLKQLKQWRQEMTRQMQPDSESDWHRLYNQQRFQQGLLMRNDLPQEIIDYLNESRNFLA